MVFLTKRALIGGKGEGKKRVNKKRSQEESKRPLSPALNPAATRRALGEIKARQRGGLKRKERVMR